MREIGRRKAARAASAALLFALAGAAVAGAQAKPVELTQWRSGLVEIDEGWAAHEGDDLKWAQPEFDDSGWKTVDLEDMGAAQSGWRWFRKRVNAGPDHPNARLLLEGGEGTYELYVNGRQIPGPRIRSAFGVSRPTERVYSLSSDNGDYSIAIRTHAPFSYVRYDFPLFMSVTLGGPTAIGYEREALESERLYGVVTSAAINLLVCLGGIWSLALFFSQRSRREYLYLGIYLVLVGISNGLWIPQQSGLLPTWTNTLFADPLTYLFAVAQIEFTFCFGGKRVGRWMRAYEAVLLLLVLPVIPLWNLELLPDNRYELIEALAQGPVALLLPLFLLVWRRRGNREAGLLILPSLFPTAAQALFGLGAVSSYLRWRSLDFLEGSIFLGPVELHPTDLAGLFFLFAIARVMFHRFTRISREEARATAEFEAAHEVQQRLVRPAAGVPGFRIESAYIPAAQVGGDFFHIRARDDGSVLAIVGDVSGKGLPAAMGVSAIMGALMAMRDLPPAEILAALNYGIHQSANGGFVTCCAIHVRRDGTMSAATAGHPSPYRNRKEIELSPGLPLGLVAAPSYIESTLLLDKDDYVVMVSDGVVEARNAGGELFGFERTAAISREPAENIARAAQQFGQEDDITVLTLALAPVEVIHA